MPHWDVGEALGILDMERGAKLSGSMFPCFKGLGARLVRALSSYALDAHADAFEEVRPPTLVRTETMMSTGHLPKFADDAYHLERDDLWAIPTSEVPLTSMYRNEILEEAELPLRYTAATSCFRREAGAAGRDTGGSCGCTSSTRSSSFVTRPASRLTLPTPTCSVERPGCWRGSTSSTGSWICARGISASRRPGRSTSRSTRPAPTCGSRSRRSAGARTTRPGGRTSATGPRGRCAGARAHLERFGPRMAPDLGGARRVRAPGGRDGGAACGARALPRHQDDRPRQVLEHARLRAPTFDIQIRYFDTAAYTNEPLCSGTPVVNGPVVKHASGDQVL